MVITLYYNDGCRHCVMFHKVIDSIEEERPHVTVTRIEHTPSLDSEVRYVPTVVVSRGDKELGRFSSALDKKEIDKWLDQLEEYIKEYLGG